jgi:putative hydrolase of the HAD superfamily
MYKAIGFDLGGVIIHYYIPELMRQIADYYNVEVGRVVDAHRRLRPEVDTASESVDEFWAKLVESISPGSDPAVTRSMWSDDYIEKNPFIPGVLDLVDRLKKAYKVGLLSNIDREHAEINYGRGIFEHFDTVLLSYEIKVRKPDRTAYGLLAERLGVKPTEAIFIDDNEENVIGAKKAGMTGILFEDRDRLIKQLEQLGIDCT